MSNIPPDGSLDTALTNGLNVPGTFTSRIINRENIGKTVTTW